jgi:hypothetical protein
MAGRCELNDNAIKKRMAGGSMGGFGLLRQDSLEARLFFAICSRLLQEKGPSSVDLMRKHNKINTYISPGLHIAF